MFDYVTAFAAETPANPKSRKCRLPRSLVDRGAQK